ncbi:MAG: TonB-dependent receptor plug domain-containing protein [Tannerella sp.]|jgi:TonB-linked SusC/RagA family outer membrane protein|nr:TonB-dependent receptor plug domain-containing protein [Tannerella sp.]
MKKVLTFLFLWTAGFLSVAQGQNKITGTVVDAENYPIIGASVAIEGTTIGITTDMNGEFALDKAPASGTLKISYIGYTTQQIKINNQTLFRIVLQEETLMLDELVVVGYGVAKKSDLTGAVAQVKSESLLLTSAGNPMQSLQGRISGVSVLSNSKPGSSPTMRIRGSGSIDANNEPLYVVDGFPLMSSDISDLNPNDIESIEVLKDASSSAIYGSRGANGVVLITTKNGSKGRNNLNVSMYAGIQSAARLVETLDRDDFIQFINDAYTADGGKPVYDESNPAPAYNTDWQKELIKKNAIVQDYSGSVRKPGCSN